MIRKSSFIDHSLMYFKSSLTQSSKSTISFLPLICHSPVIPGFIDKTFEIEINSDSHIFSYILKYGATFDGLNKYKRI